MDTFRNEEELKKKEKTKKKHLLGYVMGSVALFTVACVTIPAAMAKATGVIYKAINNTQKDDDWGPVIEKKASAVQPVPEKEDEEEA